MDYWDYLGWKDPFGSKAFTARQKAYRPRLKMRNLVTPEILVANGKLAKGWERLIVDGHAKPAAVRIRVTPDVAGRRLTAKIGLFDPVADLPEKSVVRVVLYQRKVVTKVMAGENKGKTLTEYFVVRALKDAGSAADAWKKDGVAASIDLPPGVAGGDLGLAVLVEDPEKMETIECGSFVVPAGTQKPRIVIREQNERSGNGVRGCLGSQATRQGVGLTVVTVDELPEAARKPVLLGATAAGKDTLAMATKLREKLAGLVLVDSAFDVGEAAAKSLGNGFPVLLVHGKKTAVYVRHHAKILQAAGVEVTVHSVPTTESLEVLKQSAKVIVSWAKERAED